MKSFSLITIPFTILLFGLFSCEQIPDLNPNTNIGAGISIYNLNDTIINDYFFSSVEYDLDEDGIIDFEFFDKNFGACGIIPGLRYYGLTVRGRILSINYTEGEYADNTIVSLPKVIGSNSSSLQPLTNFDHSTVSLFRGYANSGFFGCSTDWNYSISVAANKYIMFKIDIDGNFHNGWIAYSSNYDNENGIGQVVIKSIGIANEPGIVLRAGQSN